MKQDHNLKIVWFLIGMYSIVFGVFTALRHYNFQTQTGDFGIFVNIFWNTIQGNMMSGTLEEIPQHFGIHWSPFLLLLVPFYALMQSPYTLLIMQTISIALGAWPAYLLARLVLQNSRWALWIAVAYLLYPSLHWVNTYDFHEIAFLPMLLLFGIYFLHREKYIPAMFFLFLAASTKEDAILVVAFIGIWAILKELGLFGVRVGVGARETAVEYGNRGELMSKEKTSAWVKTRGKQIIPALIILFSSSVYFFIAIKILMPAFGGGLLRLDRYAYLGNSASEIIKTMINNPRLVIENMLIPQKIIYLLWVFLPVAFLPFFAPHTLILLIPGLLENLLTKYEFQFLSLYQYDAVLIAGIFVGTIYGLRNAMALWPTHQKIIQNIFIAAVFLGFLTRSPLNPLSFPTEFFSDTPHWETFRQIVRTVPPHASIAAHTNIVPHLAEREHIYMLGREPFDVDMIIIDGGDYFGFKNAEEFQAYADHYALSGNYDIQSIKDRYFVFTKKK